MHHLGRPHDSRAKRLGDRLMPETDAQQRRFSGIVADNREGNPRLIRRAGAWRDHDFLRRQRRYLLQRQRIVAPDQYFRPQFAEVLIQIPGERVIVIDKQDHSGSGTIKTGLFYSDSRASLTTLRKIATSGARSPIALCWQAALQPAGSTSRQLRR